MNEYSKLIEKNIDCREWPNVKAYDHAIATLSQQIAYSFDENERMTLIHTKHRLLSERFDQIQFNKELFKKGN